MKRLKRHLMETQVRRQWEIYVIVAIGVFIGQVALRWLG